MVVGGGLVVDVDVDVDVVVDVDVHVDVNGHVICALGAVGSVWVVSAIAFVAVADGSIAVVDAVAVDTI